MCIRDRSNAALTTVSLAKHREKKAAASMRCTARRLIATQHRQHPSSRTATYVLLSDTPAPQPASQPTRKESVWSYELASFESNSSQELKGDQLCVVSGRHKVTMNSKTACVLVVLNASHRALRVAVLWALVSAIPAFESCRNHRDFERELGFSRVVAGRYDHGCRARRRGHWCSGNQARRAVNS